MMIRRRYPFVAAAAVSAAQQQQVRAVHLPGWKTKQSTKDVRTREQREVDRKIRQIEKLPRPEALHDFQYPHEKMVLADHMFQPPVFETELDTPHLFHVTCPADFFLYWNCADFDRTSYPSVPAVDHRTLIPSFKDTEDSSSRSDGTAAAVDAEKKKTDSSRSETWIEHVALLSKYLEKHQVSPQFFPHVSHEANLAVTFNGLYGWKARRDPDTNAPLPPPPPITDLTRRNFWFTSHAGNYIELCELQDAPAVFFTTAEANDDAYYTLLIASPDYPYRTSPAIDNTKSGGGFFLHYVVSNLRGGHSLDPKRGDVVVPYVPPLPTEDAGTTRHMCILYRQTRKVPNITTLGGKHALAFEDRCNFTLHASLNHRNQHQGSSSLRDVEASLPADPVALTMFQTAWDIQVQEYYESIHQPEPAFQLDEELEAILRYNSLDGKALQINSRHQADGSVNVGMKEHQLVRWQNTQVQRGSMKNLWSRRAYLGTNGRPIVTPS